MRPPSHHSLYVPGGVRLSDSASAPESFLLHCCGFVPKNRRWDHAHVFSPFWRLYYNFSPGHHLVHAGRRIPLAPARFVLIPENVFFHCHSPHGAPGHLYLHFNLPPGRAPLLDAPVAVKADALSVAAARELAQHLKKSPPPRMAHLAAALLHRVLARLPHDHPLDRLPSPGLQKALSHIATHLSDDLSNPRLAALSGMSIRNFIRAFIREIRLSPQACVRDMRIREAARRLAGTAATIDQIAADLGFPNRSYFTRCFTRQVGQPPAAFRRNLKFNH